MSFELPADLRGLPGARDLQNQYQRLSIADLVKICQDNSKTELERAVAFHMHENKFSQEKKQIQLEGEQNGWYEALREYTASFIYGRRTLGGLIGSAFFFSIAHAKTTSIPIRIVAGLAGLAVGAILGNQVANDEIDKQRKTMG